MYQALVDGVLSPAGKGLKGTCQFCGDIMVPKCGDSRIEHWAHKKKNCDDWQLGKETAWHINWKKTIGLQFAEKRITIGAEYHIADILIEGKADQYDLLIEFQNSPISQSEIRDRETFYGEGLIWVINGRELGNKIAIDRFFLKSDIRKWIYDPEFDYYFFDGEPISGRVAYVVKIPHTNFNEDYEKFLFSEGFINDDQSVHKIKSAITKFQGIKDYGINKIDHFIDKIYYKTVPDFDLDDWYQYQNGFFKRRIAAFEKINKEYQTSISKREIITNVSYDWKYARKDFNSAKCPIFIDINEDELLQVENGSVERGCDGKLIKKKRFMERIKERSA
jgi:competence CoiA-like predicted nuclease